MMGVPEIMESLREYKDFPDHVKHIGSQYNSLALQVLEEIQAGGRRTGALKRLLQSRNLFILDWIDDNVNYSNYSTLYCKLRNQLSD